MEPIKLYPENPTEVPADLTEPRAEFRRHAWLAMAGLSAFILAYLALLGCFGWISYTGIQHFMNSRLDLVQLLVTTSAVLLTLFMAKSLFAVRRFGAPNGIEVTAAQQPELFAFIHKLADDIGAPKPHRVFLTPDVNAAVFYDLTLLNLFFPSKKNLIIGLGLVNVLTISEFKAVLAHEFGHFAQKSMMVGRWVYIAQQIIGHMLSTRDWLDKLIGFIGRIDIRIAWFGWLLALVIWSIRSVVDTLFSLVVMAERALSREMEFNADLVAVSVSGSDPLINALHKLQAADHAWHLAIEVAKSQAAAGKRLNDLFNAQRETVNAMQQILDDKNYGVTPPIPEGGIAAQHRVFTEDMARPPQMWATHPANRDREDNAKARYIAAQSLEHSAWEVFTDAEHLRREISVGFYNPEHRAELEDIAETDAVFRHFSAPSLHPTFRGNFLNRAIMRNFTSVDEIWQSGEVSGDAATSISTLYPESLKSQLAAVRNVAAEIDTLQALQRGELKPAGGVIRHRGNELKKADIPQAIAELNQELRQLNTVLKHHDASCRRAYVQAAEVLQAGWPEYLRSLVGMLHLTQHLAAIIDNERSLLVNTWLVITADKQIGFFEKRRMIKVATQVQMKMREVSQSLLQLQPSPHFLEALGIENWAQQCPEFAIVDVDKRNWADWCGAADQQIQQLSYFCHMLSDLALQDLIDKEQQIGNQLRHPEALQTTAPLPIVMPAQYPVLLPGDEHVLQRKLDLWNRFQLAQGLVPATLRLVVAASIVGGTIYAGLIFA